MMNYYTTSDLLRYIYGETSARENGLIGFQLNHDPQLLAAYRRLQNELEALDQSLEAPSEGCIQSILRHTRERASA